MIRIALIGHDTRNPNLGVGALTVSNVAILRKVAQDTGVQVQISVLVGTGDAPCCVEGPDVQELFVRPLRKPLGFFREILQHDLVIDISGGDSFADIYGNRRIFQILFQKYLVHLARRPLALAPQTIGPFSRGLWRRLAAGSLRRSAVVCTRDAKSTVFLAEMGVERGDVIEASDVAFRLPYDAPNPRPDGHRPKVGINVSGLLMSGGYTGRNQFGLSSDYATLIRDLISSFLALEDGCEVHLVGHVVPQNRGGVEDDYQACMDLAEEFPETIVAPAFKTPSEAKTYIAGLDFFMGARMHACIAAFSSGVPVVPMAYSRKFEGLFGALGYHQTVDCTKDRAEDIKTRILAAYEDREALKQVANTAADRGREKLMRYEGVLKELLSRGGRIPQ